MRTFILRLIVVGATVLGCAATSEARLVQGSRSVVMDSAEFVPVLTVTLAEVKAEFPFGRVLFDRSVIDTTKRLAPAFVGRREHPRPEDWTRPNAVEPVQTDAAQPVCQSGLVDCYFPNGTAGVIAFSDPVVFGGEARVIVRYSMNVEGPVARVRTRVEAFTLRKADGAWKVTGRKLRASS